MRYNVSALLKGGVGETRAYPIDAECLTEGGEQIACQSGHVRLTRTKGGILVDATVDVAVRCTCARCLEPFECPLHLRFSEEFLPTIDVTTGVPLPIPEDGAFVIDDHHILDLGEAIRQYAVLEIPIQPLCRAECAGICPSCGQDLNTARCSCDRLVGDARLAALRDILPKVEGTNGAPDDKP